MLKESDRMYLRCLKNQVLCRVGHSQFLLAKRAFTCIAYKKAKQAAARPLAIAQSAHTDLNRFTFRSEPPFGYSATRFLTVISERFKQVQLDPTGHLLSQFSRERFETVPWQRNRWRFPRTPPRGPSASGFLGLHSFSLALVPRLASHITSSPSFISLFFDLKPLSRCSTKNNRAMRQRGGRLC